MRCAWLGRGKVYHPAVSIRRIRTTAARPFRRLGASAVLAALALAAGPVAAEPAYTNRLIDSNDPYLLAHAHNPVDWYPWGQEALDKAKRENRPIFLSIGYSTCYWCHVAERTLFSNPQIAELMNQWFVNIKVDREERPDLDAIYMLATQLLTGGPGGWPNNVFLTPDLMPFYAGGYFPPEDDPSKRPGFPSVLAAVHAQWTEYPQQARKRAEGIVSVLRRYQAQAQDAQLPPEPAQWAAQSRAAILQRFDAEHGGLGGARRTTKFPQSPMLASMLADYRRSRDRDTLHFLTVSLDAMAYGGLYDQLGGGFHRYATDRTWSIPHFEKMLYDNAQLLAVYATAWQLTGRPQYKRTALGVRAYLRQRLLSADGGFYTAEDAAVDGEEGANIVWTRAQIETVLAWEAARFFEVYALTPVAQEAAVLDSELVPGVLRVHAPEGVAATELELRIAALEPARRKLLEARATRPQPARDEKLLVGLNGLAIEGFCTSARVFRSPEDLQVARRAAQLIWSLAWDPRKKRLGHQVFQGRAQGEGFLDDYGLLGGGMLALYRATGEEIWLQRARLLADVLLQRFDADGDGRLASSVAAENLIVLPMEQGDDAYPSGTSAAVALLLRLSEASGSRRYAEAARRATSRVQGPAERWPTLVAALNASSRHSNAPAMLPEAAVEAAAPGQSSSARACNGFAP